MTDSLYFDNAATTYPKPEEVYLFMDKYYRNTPGSYARSTVKCADSADAIVKNTRKMLLKLFNAKNDYFAILQSSATEAMNTILKGCDYLECVNIYITHFEHNAILRTLYDLNKCNNITVTHLIMKSDKSDYDLEGIKNQFISLKPNLVIMTHASNTFGLITPIVEIGKLATNAGAKVIIDAAQTAGLLTIDLQECKFDGVVFAGHKTLYGPYGVGGMILKKSFNIKPLIYGGTGNDSANLEMPIKSEKRFEAGTMNMLSISGLYQSLKWIEKIGIEKIRIKEFETKNKLINILKKYDFIELYEYEDQIGVISINHVDYSSDEFAKILTDFNVINRAGLHCAPDAHKYIGTFPCGTVRLSVSYFTDDIELNKFDEILYELEVYS